MAAMAAAGLSEKTGDRLKRHESNPKLQRTGSGASAVCTRFFRKTDTPLSRSFRVSYRSAARRAVACTGVIFNRVPMGLALWGGMASCAPIGNRRTARLNLDAADR